jgi:hypothetical protein
MSTKNIQDKTDKIVEKQRELNKLVLEIKNDVGRVEQENERLRNELAELKKTMIEPKETIVQEPRKSIQQEDILKPKLETKEKAPVIEKAIPEKVISQKKVRSEKENAFIEFFLGKNVIVKIAAILMVLAVITFGQIAYIDFLNDFGRFMLIIGIAVFFIGLAYFFEKKSNTVFNNIFYLLGLVLLLVDNFLAIYEYNLYGNTVFMIYLIAITLLPLVYFYKKPDDFLHLSIVPYYAFILLSPIIVYGNEGYSSFGRFFLIGLIIISSGYAIYHAMINQIPKKSNIIIVNYVILTIFAIIINIFSEALVFSNQISFAHFTVLMYQILFIALYYLFNIKGTKKRSFNVQVSILLSTSITFIILGISLTESVYGLFSIRNNSLWSLFSVLLFVPLYTYFFIKRKERDNKIINAYLVILSILALIFTFFVDKGAVSISQLQNYNRTLPYWVKNLILLIETSIIFTLASFTKDKIQRYVSYGFIGVLVFTSSLYTFLSPGNQNLSEWAVFLPTIIISIYLFVHTLQMIKEEKYTKEIVTCLLIFSGLPLFLNIGNDLILEDTPIKITTMVIYLIGMRQLLKWNVFKSTYLKEITLGINVFIVILTLSVNAFYFNHNLRIWMDVFKLLYVFLVNVYLIQALREMYRYMIKIYTYEKETWFIIFYVIGTIIQALFITTYINVSFDKVVLSSYYMISASIAVLFGFRNNWLLVRKIGLFAIYFSLAKFFVYDFFRNDFSMYVRFLSYFILAIVLFGISALYNHLEKTYGSTEE